MANMIAGIILAAGESSRMGQPKQLLPWKNTFILRQVIENAAASALGAVIVVLGHRADEIKARLGEVPATIVLNEDYRHGMGTSLTCGVRNSAKQAVAFMTLLGDQPMIGPEVIDEVIESYRHNGKGIVVPVYGGKRGHPVIFDKKYRAELLALDERGAREILLRHADDILEIELPSDKILIDIDTPQEYKDAVRRDGMK